MNKEKKDKVKGICGTLLFHALLFFLLSLPFMSLNYEDPPARKGGGSIAINFNSNPIPQKSIEQEEKMIEDQDVINAETGEIEVNDNNNEEEKKKEDKPIEETTSVIKLSEEEQAFDINKDGVLNEKERKKLNEFLANIENPFNNKNDDSDGNGEELGDGEKSGNNKGFGNGLSKIDGIRKSPENFDYPIGKGEGYITIDVIVNSDGEIIDVNDRSFVCNFAVLSKKERDNLYKAIQQKLRYGEAIGRDKTDKIANLKINFKH